MKALGSLGPVGTVTTQRRGVAGSQAGWPTQAETHACSKSGAGPSAAANQKETAKTKAISRGKAEASRKEEREQDLPAGLERDSRRGQSTGSTAGARAHG